MLFFSAELVDSTNTNGSTSTSTGSVALMRSDGTNNGTEILKSFDSVTNLVNADGELYFIARDNNCLLYTSPSPRDVEESRMPSSA